MIVRSCSRAWRRLTQWPSRPSTSSAPVAWSASSRCSTTSGEFSGYRAQGVADLVGQAAGAKVEDDVADVLGAAVAVERRALHEAGGERMVAGVGAVAGVDGLLGHGLGGAVDVDGGDQLFELPLGLGAAGGTFAQVLLGPAGDGGRVGLAQVAAGPAVELGHGRHHHAGPAACRRPASSARRSAAAGRARGTPPARRPGRSRARRARRCRPIRCHWREHVHQTGEEAAPARPAARD